MGGHRQARVTSRPWSIQLPPIPDELLSSYLARSAHAHGLHPMRFVAMCFPGRQVWTRDIDRQAPACFQDEVAHASDLPIDAVKAMTLTSYLPKASQRTNENSGALSWCTSVGMHGRWRTRYGLQYCPRCLDAQGAFLRTWRLVFAFACPVHGLMLEDCCGICGAPIIPHRTRHALSNCHCCGALLGAGACRDTALVLEALRVQARFLGFCGHDRIDINGTSVENAELFWGLGILMKILREKMHSHSTEFHVQDRLVLDNCELLRSSPAPMRLRLCASVLDVLEQWPDAFLNIAKATNMTRAAFAHYGKSPSWLEEQVNRLPQRLRPRYAYRGATFIEHVRQIEADGGKNCRARRACALMAAAGRRI
jgi:hypothetical protein